MPSHSPALPPPGPFFSVSPNAGLPRAGSPPAVEYPEGQAERSNRIMTFSGGKARGRLVGGNLSLVSPLVGTPYQPDYEGAILFLEDVNEAFYRLDRMLTHLLLAGVLEKLSGIVMGKFTKIGEGDLDWADVRKALVEIKYAGWAAAKAVVT